MKKIGFIDYYLDEWHANNYPAMIAAYNRKNNSDYQLAYAWGEIDNPSGGLSNREWCEKFSAKLCGSIEEVCERSDHVIILAPSDPERHLDYAGRVFACKASPYIDKTFAPDCKTAKAIFDLAGKNGVKFFSSSALRYADELSVYNGDARSIYLTGGGSNFDEYIIHQLEMAVKCLGVGAESVRYEKYADQEYAEAAYCDGRHAKLFFSPCLPFTAAVAGADGRSAYHRISSPYFDNLIADIIRFFETGETSFDSAETLEVMKLREAVIAGKSRPGEWIRL